MRIFRFFGLMAGLGLAASGVVLAQVPTGIAPPPRAVSTAAPVQDVVQVLHGVTVHDPYRYMEDVSSAPVQQWLKAQAAIARTALDGIAGRAEMLDLIERYADATGDRVRNTVHLANDQWFYEKRVKGGKQFKLMVRYGFDGSEAMMCSCAVGTDCSCNQEKETPKALERVLVDPEELAKRTGVPHAVNYFVPSWDGKYVAYGMSAGGSEDTSLYIIEVATGKQIGEPIPRVHDALVSWTPDSKSFTYNQLKELKPSDSPVETYLDSKVMWLQLGQTADKAVALFGPTVTTHLGLARLDVGKVFFSPDSQWMVAQTTDTTLPEGFVFVAPVSQLSSGKVQWRKIADYSDKLAQVELRGDYLYTLSYKGAPHGQVTMLDLDGTGEFYKKIIATPPPNTVLESFTLSRHALVAQIRHNSNVGLRCYRDGDLTGQDNNVIGASELQSETFRADDFVAYTYASWTQSPTHHALDCLGSNRDLAFSTDAPRVDMSREFEVTEVQAKSWDGAMVPMAIVHKKGIALNGSNPTLLDGYGAYGFSETAHFSPANMAWLERGGVLAFANVRGSSVYGDAWYKAGFKSTKHNTWRDGIACAQYLIEHGYASPKTLGIMGTSAGGIFVGRAVTEAPQLFAAAIFNVGIMDAVRAEESANGITNISEFGTVKDPEEFKALLEMSTYHQIKDRTAYPAVLLIHGMNDPRVDVWNSAKAAARLQAATSSGKPILLRLDTQAGHGMGNTATQRNAQAADIYSFLLWQMGKVKGASN